MDALLMSESYNQDYHYGKDWYWYWYDNRHNHPGGTVLCSLARCGL